MAIATVPMREGAELVGEYGYRYLLVKAMGQPNVWVAVDAASQEKIFIVKQPGEDDVARGWPRFQHEMVMHELFKDTPSVRQQVDRIPPTSKADPPRIVLEILESTLWEARRKRQFSDVELKGIMRSTLMGLRDVHQKDMVYADLKMENILVSGFEHKANKDETIVDSNIVAKLGDLGIVMSPVKGLVQPIVYRAPEVYFRHEISPAADIWSWGLIYCQLLEAQASFHKCGMYDDLLQGSHVQKERLMERAIAHDFGLGSLDYYDGCALPYHDRAHREGQHWDHLRSKGVAEKEIEFLQWVLNPVPTDRPTAQNILDAGWLTPDSSEATGGVFASIKALVNPARKRSDSALFNKFDNKQQPMAYIPWKPSASTKTISQPPAFDNKQPIAYTPWKLSPETSKKSQLPALDTRAAVLPREDPHNNARPATPRSSTGGRPGGTFLSYGAFMG
ncbi:kinase-like protein [Clathrospora elynae]|uniref:Kinase-like protein n=1 Tax=Clathrospora elynae TaxID=706981 RepID=A0A6A5T3D0_9PLEO|nr:kinase-like protein [Clathrospora elynae]